MVFALFLFIELKFEKKFPKIVLTEKDKEIEMLTDMDLINRDTEFAMGEGKIVKILSDLNFANIFNFALVIALLTYFTIESFFKFDLKRDPSIFVNIPIYLLVYNISDTVGKFLPSQFFILKAKDLHIFNFLKLVILFYFVGIFVADPEPGLLNSPFIRMIAIGLLGAQNGYITNCLMAQAANRF